MQWQRQADATTQRDARASWRLQTGLLLPEGAKAEYWDLTLPTLLALPLESVGLHRLQAVAAAQRNGLRRADALAAVAYPELDRPRGRPDLDSVTYHAATAALISPVLVVRFLGGGRPRYVLADGVHRLLAAAIRGSPVRVAFLTVSAGATSASAAPPSAGADAAPASAAPPSASADAALASAAPPASAAPQ